MDQVIPKSYNEILESGSMMRMISMLQPLGSNRRLENVDYLLLGSDFILAQQITKRKDEINPRQQMSINTQSSEYKNVLEIRKLKQLRVQEDLKNMQKVIQYNESKIQNPIRARIRKSEYFLDQASKNLQQPQDVIRKFFAESRQNTQGFVIYFSGQVTQGVPCMAFQIQEQIYLVTVHQIIEIWRNYLTGFTINKHLFLIIESPYSGTFLDGIHRFSDKLEHYNISFLMSEKEKRFDNSNLVKKFEQTQTSNNAYLQRVDEQDITPTNFVYQQDFVLQISDYQRCSEFTAALCEYMLNSPPKRMIQLYETKPQIYLNQLAPQPGFYGFSMKNYLDFGWNFDINYQRMLKQSSINYFGIERQNYNLSMEDISALQNKIIFKANNYFGLVKNKFTDKLNYSDSSKGQYNISDISQKNKTVQIDQFSENENNDQTLQSNQVKNQFTRHCNGLQFYMSDDKIGAKYFGQWKDNQQNGMGIAVYKDGNRYEGQFIDGKRCGYGVLYNKQNKDKTQEVYIGQFYNDKFYGKGMILWTPSESKCFMGNFSGSEATGYALKSDGDKTFGAISDKFNFKQKVEDHELFMDTGDEKDEFEPFNQTQFYEFKYQNNDIKKLCNFDQKIAELKIEQQERQTKAKNILDKFLFQGGYQEKQNSEQLPQDLPKVEDQPFDITQTQEYQELKSDLTELNPDIQNESVEPQEVEFFAKHAAFKDNLDDIQLEERKEKTEQFYSKLNSILEKSKANKEGQKNNEKPAIKDEQESEIQINGKEIVKNYDGDNDDDDDNILNSKDKETCNLIPLVAMKEFYGNKGINLFITDDKNFSKSQSDNYKESLLSIGQSNNTEYLEVRIKDEHGSNKFEDIIDEDKKRQFIIDFKQKLALAHRCNSEDIFILGLTKGSIRVDYKLADGLEYSTRTNEEADKIFYKQHRLNLKVHSLLEYATLTPENCDARYNEEWPKKKITWRGGLIYKNIGFVRQHYILPFGWKGFGLNISKYKDNQNWLAETDQATTWIVLYHGTNLQGLEGIAKDGFRSGNKHKYAGSSCRITGEIIGNDKNNKCVYLTDDVSDAEKYATPFMIKDVAYRMVFQCRVNPKVVRSPRQKDSYYIVQEKDNPSFNIRPYRILLKKLTEKQVQEYKELEQNINQEVKEIEDLKLKEQERKRLMEQNYKENEMSFEEIKRPNCLD